MLAEVGRPKCLETEDLGCLLYANMGSSGSWGACRAGHGAVVGIRTLEGSDAAVLAESASGHGSSETLVAGSNY